ncbi:MAG: hypothetical protein GVY06_06490 [Alphaproteobacteria bacterium]|jgi:hypothetical protein|nr:hypothetical protein [Alphaproteobacteria bacterium]
MTGAVSPGITALCADTLARMRQHATGLAGFGALAAGLVALSLHVPVWAGALMLLAALWAVQAMVAVQMPARAAPAATPQGMATFAKVLSACALLCFVLGFLLLLTLLTTTLVVIGVMAGSGFDFDLAGSPGAGFDQAMAAYRDTPGWLICQGVFLFGLAVWVYGVARSLPFLPGVIAKRRVIVLEAQKWSRGYGLKILAALILVMTLPVLLAASGFRIAPAIVWMRAPMEAIALLPAFYVAGAFLGALDIFIPGPETDPVVA